AKSPSSPGPCVTHARGCAGETVRVLRTWLAASAISLPAGRLAYASVRGRAWHVLSAATAHAAKPRHLFPVPRVRGLKSIQERKRRRRVRVVGCAKGEPGEGQTHPRVRTRAGRSPSMRFPSRACA